MNFGRIVFMVRCATKYGLSNALKLYSPSFRSPTLTRLNLKSLRHPFWMRKGKYDELVFREVVILGVYDQECIRSMKDVKFILDAGAHIGLATVQFASWFPDAKIISIEPDEANLAVLRRNAVMYPNVAVIHGALWHRSVNLVIENPESNSTGFQVCESVTGSLPGYSIPDLMQRFGADKIDILKMDIEGAEREIFEAPTNQWLPNTRVISIELHDWMKAGCAFAFYSKAVSRPFSQYQPQPGTVDIIQFV